MALYQIENEVQKIQAASRETKKESLQAQLYVLDAWLTRHRLWAEKTNDMEIASIHIEIIALLGKVVYLYKRLLSI
jgi:hypothetical protein